MIDQELTKYELEALITGITHKCNFSPEQVERLRGLVEDESTMLHVCAECCQQLAVLAMDEDISRLWYDADGKLNEEIVDGEAVTKLCRECGGDHAQYVPLAPWEE